MAPKKPSPAATGLQASALAGALGGALVGELIGLALWLWAGPGLWAGLAVTPSSGPVDLAHFYPGSWPLLAGLATLAYASLLGAVGGMAVGTLAHPVLRRPHRILGLVVGLGIGGWIFVLTTTRGQLDRLGGVPLDHPARLRMALLHGAIALLAGLVLGGLVARQGRHWAPRGRGLVWTMVPALVALGFVLLAEQSSGAPEAIPRTAESPRIVVVGLDGLSLRVLAPAVEAGELPTFARLMEEGAWGPLMTYGTTSSPRVWTTLATGQKFRVHGIDDFVRPQGGYRAATLGSADRRSPAFWNLLGTSDRRVAVVNWLVTHPPEGVHGAMVTRLAGSDPGVHPPELADALASWLEDPATNSGPEATGRAELAQQRRLGTADRVFEVAERLLDRQAIDGRIDLLALYDNAADSAQHLHWRDHEPAAFDASAWGDVHSERRPWVLDVYRHADRRLARLLERSGPNTLVFVVSDHGQLAARAPRIRLRLDRLLAELGYLEQTADGRPRHRRSRAYPLVETLWTPTLRVNLNLEGREPHGVVPTERAEALLDRLERDLKRLRFDDGAPLFARIERAALDRPRGQGGADLELLPSARLQQTEVVAATLDLAGAPRPMTDFALVDPTISGEHDHRGLLIVHGPGVRPGFLGQRSLETPLHRLLWHLTDKIETVDLLLPALRSLGLLDRASTLDLTPTLLWLMGEPIARDMPGRALRELFVDPPPLDLRETYRDFVGGGYPVSTAPPEPDTEPIESDTDREMIEQLRALGYVG